MLDPGEEYPTDQVEGDSIKLTPKKLGIISGVDEDAVEDASVDTLSRVCEALARAIATKLDARAFSTAAADKGPAGLLGTFSTLTEAVSVISILKAVAANRGDHLIVGLLDSLDAPFDGAQLLSYSQGRPPTHHSIVAAVEGINPRYGLLLPLNGGGRTPPRGPLCRRR